MPKSFVLQFSRNFETKHHFFIHISTGFIRISCFLLRINVEKLFKSIITISKSQAWLNFTPISIEFH